jgi:hypothetical protein
MAGVEVPVAGSVLKGFAGSTCKKPRVLNVKRLSENVANGLNAGSFAGA